MNQQPMHYDGRFHLSNDSNGEHQQEIPLELTEEMRKNIGQNPYSTETNE